MKSIFTLAVLALSFNAMASSLSGAYSCQVSGEFINETKEVSVGVDKGIAMDFMMIEADDDSSSLHNRHGMNSRMVEVTLKHSKSDDGFPETITMSVAALDSVDLSSWADIKDSEILSYDGAMQTKSNDGLISVNCQKK